MHRSADRSDENHPQAPSISRHAHKHSKSQRHGIEGERQQIESRGVQAVVAPPPVRTADRGGSRQDFRRSDRETGVGHDRPSGRHKQHRDISHDWSDFQRERPPRQEQQGQRQAKEPQDAPARTPPPNIKSRAASPGASFLAELRKAGQSLLDRRSGTPEQPRRSAAALEQSPPRQEPEDLEAGEIPEHVGSEEKKRKAAAAAAEPFSSPSKAARLAEGTDGRGMLSRLSVASFQRQQEELELGLDVDAPAAVKSSPSISEDEEENELDVKYRAAVQAVQAAQAATAGVTDNTDDEDALEGGSKPSSRWLTDHDAAEPLEGPGPTAQQQEGLASAEHGRRHADRGAPSSSGGLDAESEEPGSPPPSPRTLLNRKYDMRQECRNVDEFEKISRISEGTYGVVYKAREKATGRLVALKMIKMDKEKDGFPITSIREINVLLNFHHKNIVLVSEICVNFKKHDQVFMVMELMDHDLKSVMDPKAQDTIRMTRRFSVSDIKNLMLQLLDGVQYLHKNWVLHRDLKASNILYNAKGELKICDFGLARQYGSPLKPYTHMVVTLWYRAPELLLGTKIYSTAIDVWSVGCIMGELLLGAPLMPGQSEFDQLDKIVSLLGTPTEEVWPGLKELPNYGKIKLKQVPSQLRSKFQTSYGGGAMLTEAGFDLLSQLLAWDPEQRISAADAMKHRWFRETPLPQKQELMPTFAPR